MLGKIGKWDSSQVFFFISFLFLMTTILEGNVEGDEPGSVQRKQGSLKRHRLNPNYDPSTHIRRPIKIEHGVENGLHIGVQTTTRRTTTEPDWDYVCYVLCGNGQGGLACDCDLMPIGK